MNTGSITSLVVPSAGAGVLRPLHAAGVRVAGGFWGDRLAANRARTIPHGLVMLETSGALGNFRNAARATGRYVGGLDDAGVTFPFLDSDVYKWLEAVGWELGREADPVLAARAGEVIDLVASAQRPDGYLGTFVQLSGRAPFSDLQWGHELYCIGHLAQAAVAWQRALGDGRLLAIVRRAIERIDAELGDGRREGMDGHPEVEMALVELYRLTHEERFLRLASVMVERRGRGLQGPGRMGPRYWQDHAPVREAPAVTGHAVRQLYLDCGVVDVATETGDRSLLDAVVRRWEDMWAARAYLTGALGSRHRDEAFGDPYELPSDRAYAETCAAIASVMLNWRLLLATGEARFGDALERTLYNAVLPGVSLDGTRFFYVNPLHRREQAAASGRSLGAREPWYACACCPPNVMRTLSSFEHLVAAQDDRGLSIVQFADGVIRGQIDGEAIVVRVATDYPWDGRVSVTIEASPARPWVLRLRVPAWAREAGLRLDGSPITGDAGEGWVGLDRTWATGDRSVLDMPMPARFTVPDRHVDAIRGCVALERGPLVYCLERPDLPDGTGIEDVAIATAIEPSVAPVVPGLPGVVGIRVAGRRAGAGSATAGSLYRALDAGHAAEPTTPVDLLTVPYFAWANREPGAMRVWLPIAADDPASD